MSWISRIRRNKEVLREALKIEASKWKNLAFREWSEKVKPFVDYRTSYEGLVIEWTVTVLDVETDMVSVDIVGFVVPEHMDYLLIPYYVIRQNVEKVSGMYEFHEQDIGTNANTLSSIIPD
jgi:hypothetical protein